MGASGSEVHEDNIPACDPGIEGGFFLGSQGRSPEIGTTASGYGRHDLSHTKSNDHG